MPSGFKSLESVVCFPCPRGFKGHGGKGWFVLDGSDPSFSRGVVRRKVIIYGSFSDSLPHNLSPTSLFPKILGTSENFDKNKAGMKSLTKPSGLV